MNLQEFKNHVINEVKHSKKLLSEKRPTVTVDIDIFIRKGGGKNERYVFALNGKEYESDFLRLSAVQEVSRMMESVAREIDAVRGYNVCRVEKEFWYEDRDVFGRTMNYIQITQGIMLHVKPCKEFVKLCKTLEKHADISIHLADLYSVNISGKRGGNWRESGSKTYYAFSPRICTVVLEWIHKNKRPSDRLIANIEEGEDCEDMEYSRRYETECYGVKHRYLSLVIQKGRGIRKTFNTMYVW